MLMPSQMTAGTIVAPANDAFTWSSRRRRGTVTRISLAAGSSAAASPSTSAQVTTLFAVVQLPRRKNAGLRAVVRRAMSVSFPSISNGIGSAATPLTPKSQE